MSAGVIDGNVQALFMGTLVIDPASVATITTAEQTFTFPGVRTTDVILSVTKPTNTAGLGIVNARVSAANTIAITFVNPTAGAVDAPSQTYTIVFARPDADLVGGLP